MRIEEQFDPGQHCSLGPTIPLHIHVYRIFMLVSINDHSYKMVYNIDD